jgi:hypothetical protein
MKNEQLIMANRRLQEKLGDAISRRLVELGWPAAGRPALSTKAFLTAVGVRNAHVYLQNYGVECENFLLTGEYRSEGRNCLGNVIVAIPRTVEVGALAPLVEKFVAMAHAAICDTYAMKLFLSKPELSLA